MLFGVHFGLLASCILLLFLGFLKVGVVGCGDSPSCRREREELLSRPIQAWSDASKDGIPII